MIKLPDGVYDVLKWVTMLLLPAFATLIVAIGKIWGWELAPQISETVVAINAFLAMIIGVSTINYNRS